MRHAMRHICATINCYSLINSIHLQQARTIPNLFLTLSIQTLTLTVTTIYLRNPVLKKCREETLTAGNKTVATRRSSDVLGQEP